MTGSFSLTDDLEILSTKSPSGSEEECDFEYLLSDEDLPNIPSQPSPNTLKLASSTPAAKLRAPKAGGTKAEQQALYMEGIDDEDDGKCSENGLDDDDITDFTEADLARMPLAIVHSRMDPEAIQSPDVEAIMKEYKAIILIGALTLKALSAELTNVCQEENTVFLLSSSGRISRVYKSEDSSLTVGPEASKEEIEQIRKVESSEMLLVKTEDNENPVAESKMLEAFIIQLRRRLVMCQKLEIDGDKVTRCYALAQLVWKSLYALEDAPASNGSSFSSAFAPGKTSREQVLNELTRSHTSSFTVKAILLASASLFFLAIWQVSPQLTLPSISPYQTPATTKEVACVSQSVDKLPAIVHVLKNELTLHYEAVCKTFSDLKQEAAKLAFLLYSWFEENYRLAASKLRQFEF